jgi:HemK-related putative methylase
MNEVYKPAEDSLLLLRNAKKLAYGSVLEVGTGNGFIAVEIATRSSVDNVVAVDINPKAIAKAKKKAEEAGISERIEFLVSDLFQSLEGRRFDWILFNPPYLPSEGAYDEASWAGGKSGNEVLMRFLGDASNHLRPNGAIIMVYSSHTGLDIKEIEKRYSTVVLEEVHIFFEMLTCIMLRVH